MKDFLELVASSRPSALDEDPATRPDPGEIMAHARRQAAPSRSRSRRRLVLAGAAPAGALAVALAVIVGIGANHPNTPAGTAASPGNGNGNGSGSAAPTRTTPKTAQEVFLVAAEQTARTAGSGKYVRVESDSGERTEVGPRSHPYAIMRRHHEDRWTPTEPGGTFAIGVRDLGAKPAGKADEEAWKADGSPKQWTQKSPDGLPDIVISTEPGGMTGYQRVKGDIGQVLGGAPITAKELAALPTDPAKLRAWLLARFKQNDSTEPADYSLFVSGELLITQLPITPAVRAATFRMLATVGGVKMLGTKKDQLGRSGEAVGFFRKGSESRVIVDTANGQILGVEAWHGDTLEHYQVIVALGYTNDNPPA